MASLLNLLGHNSIIISVKMVVVGLCWQAPN